VGTVGPMIQQSTVTRQAGLSAEQFDDLRHAISQRARKDAKTFDFSEPTPLDVHALGAMRSAIRETIPEGEVIRFPVPLVEFFWHEYYSTFFLFRDAPEVEL
jgi:hypothetical protein